MSSEPDELLVDVLLLAGSDCFVQEVTAIAMERININFFMLNIFVVNDESKIACTTALLKRMLLIGYNKGLGRKIKYLNAFTA